MSRRKTAVAAVDDDGSESKEEDVGEGSEDEEEDEEEEEEESDDDASYDSNVDDVVDSDDSDDDDGVDDESDDGFEDQGSSDEDDDDVDPDDDDGSDDDGGGLETLELTESVPRAWRRRRRDVDGASLPSGSQEQRAAAALLHADDLSSDDEDADATRNRIGRVPLHWYDEHEHLGYDGRGDKVVKPSSSEKGDLLDAVVAQGDENARLTVTDELRGTEVEVDGRDLELLRRVQAGAFAHPEFDGNPEGVDYYSSIKETSGLHSDKYEPKNRFQPSKWEALRVRRLLHRLRRGKITMDYLLTGRSVKRDGPAPPGQPFALWTGEEEDELNMRGKGPRHVPAPKQAPPGHAASYRPPPEYLPTEEEKEAWREMDAVDRPHGLLVPKSFDGLRQVGAYEHAVRERFERCLDLYLCPRAMKRRLNIDPESLVPSLPKAADLRPFPTARCVRYQNPERSVVRSLTVSPDGRYLVSGSDDGYARLWEVSTGRLCRSWNLSETARRAAARATKVKDDGAATTTTTDDPAVANDPVVSVRWNPAGRGCLLAAVGRCAVVVATGTSAAGDAETDHRLLSAPAARLGDKVVGEVEWVDVDPNEDATDDDDDDSKNKKKAPLSAHARADGPVRVLVLTREAAAVGWHRRGDYFFTVAPRAPRAAAVLVHRLGRAVSQRPFSKPFKNGAPTAAAFHPTRPFLFVSTPTDVRVYHLAKGKLAKRLLTGCRSVSDLAVHPSGDHVVVGSLDRRVAWFDLDLGVAPYRTLKYHERAVRAVDFHPRRPLLASASDDGKVHVFHATVYDDLARNPLLVPVKVLRHHRDDADKDADASSSRAALATVFHPSQPWLFTGGADGNVTLWQDL